MPPPSQPLLGPQRRWRPPLSSSLGGCTEHESDPSATKIDFLGFKQTLFGGLVLAPSSGTHYERKSGNRLGDGGAAAHHPG
jgi:hypothetical protein